MKPNYPFHSIAALTVSLMLFLTVNSQAQSRHNMSGLDQTTFEIIKTRTSILDDFKKKDFARIKKERDSLRKAFETDNHLAFFPAEYWLLCFWTKDYTAILNDKFLSDTNQYNNTYVSYPVFDNMGDDVRKETRNHLQTIADQITASTLNAKEKDFLHVVLYYSVHKSTESKDTIQVKLNELAKAYVTNNPTSPNNGMINSYMVKEYIGLSGGDEIFFGVGYSLTNGKLQKYLSNAYNFGIDYRRYIGSSFFGISGSIIYSGKIADSILVNGYMLQHDESYNIYNLGLDIGNRLFDTKRISFSIYGGASYNEISVTHITDVTKNLSKIVDISSYAARIGFAFDFKFVKQGIYAAFKQYNDYNHSNFFRLKYDYLIPMYSNKVSELTGGIHNITLSIGVNTRQIVKK